MSSRAKRPGHATVNAYKTHMLVITISRARVPFSIHQGILERTGFFEVHGEPATLEEKAATAATTISDSDKLAELHIKNEDGVTVPNQVDVVADYHIQERFFWTPNAFGTFVGWLYNEELALDSNSPTARGDRKNLLNVYVLAIKYKAYSLQNEIVELFRKYHRTESAKFEELWWMSNRVGDDSETAMTAYLIEQIAYDISTEGYDGYVGAHKNSDLPIFLKDGTRNIRVELFKAIARQANSEKSTDPAKGQNRWLVVETGEAAGQRKTVGK